MALGNKKSLLDRWKNRTKKDDQNTGITPLAKGISAPLSLGQQRLLFLQQLYPQNPFYHYADAYRFRGDLNIKLLFESFDIIAHRHDILRTTFEIKDNKAIQEINSVSQIETETIDLRAIPQSDPIVEANRVAIKAAQKPFDLEKGPLTRITVLELADNDFLVVLSMHHIITDKWSMAVLRKELSAIYSSLILKQPHTLKPLSIQYADFSNWQTKNPIDQNSLAFWKNKLSGDLPILNLPIDNPRTAIPSYRGAYNAETLSPELSLKLKVLAKEFNCTPFIFLLTVYKVLLFRYSNQEDLLIGTPITNRDQTAIEELIGFFNNTVVLRSDLSGNPSFSDLIEQVRMMTLEAMSNKNVPFETLVKELKTHRQLSINPIFQAMFLYHKVPPTPSFGSDLEIEYKPFDFGVAKFDLTLYVSEDENQLSTTFEYATDLFEKETIERMQTHFKTLLESIIKNPSEKIEALNILPTEEQNLQLSIWNDNKVELPDYSNIQQLIEEQYTRNPQQVAVVFQNKKLTYEELNNQANAVANHLQKSGVIPNTFVGLYTERSLEMIVGILGILKAGGAYLPLDPQYPTERINFMIEDAKVPIILTQDHLIDSLSHSSAEVFSIHDISKSAGEQLQKPTIKKEDTAYIIYTSGSTGKPKGVVATHENLIHSTTSRFHFYSKSPQAFLLLSSFAFDSSVAGIFWTLCSGGTLVLAKRRIEQNLEELGHLIETHKVTHTLLLPSLYSVIIQNISIQKLNSLNTVIVAGEACSGSLCHLHYSLFKKGVKLYNEYGPTEASVWCIAHELTPEDTTGKVPIGRPISNTQIYILDKNMQPAPIGISGELYIGGTGITQGYFNQPALTNTQFISNPFSADRNDKLYRTGDLASYRSNGIIDFLGRADYQVKIRGYRIEMKEIEEVIRAQEDVHEVIVVNHQEGYQSEMETDEVSGLAEKLESLEEHQVEELLTSIELMSDDKIDFLLTEIVKTKTKRAN